jgi:TonB system transport protein ExbD (group 1)
MAMKVNDGDDDLSVNHEINVTPFIDVMLVLLIIFMVAAPLATVNVPVELPVSRVHSQPPDQEPVFVTVQVDHTLSIGENSVSAEGLAPALNAATKGDKTTRLFLRADKKVDYGALMDVMNELRDAGYVKVALVGLATSQQAGMR